MKENMKKMILIVGKTRSGKDTIARYLEKNHKVNPIISYTTRPKRENEVDGREHWFITKEKMQEIKDSGTMIAYTINDVTGYEYCATYMDLDSEKWYSYIINPEGVRYLLAHNYDANIFMHIIYCDCAEDTLAERGQERGEDPEVFKTRLASERHEFDYFLHEWNKIINGHIYTGSLKLEQMESVATDIFNSANNAYNRYTTSYISKGFHVIKFSEGDKCYLKNFHGKKTVEAVSIKRFINDVKLYDEPYVILYEYPDTCFRLYDITDKITNPFDYIICLFNSIKKWLFQKI